MPLLFVGLSGLGLGSLFGFTVSQGFKKLLYLLLALAAAFVAYKLGWFS